MLIPDAPAPGRMKPVNGFEKLGANGGTRPVTGSMKNRLPARTSSRRPVESNPWRPVVRVALALVGHKRQNDRIELVDPTDVIDVCIDLVSKPDVQRQLRVHAPVVLDVSRNMHIVGVRDLQILIGTTAAQRHRKQQVVVVDTPVAIPVEGWKVLDELDTPVAEHTQIERGIHALNLATELPMVSTPDERERVGELPAFLDGALRYSE
jgi:hypothetical protein